MKKVIKLNENDINNLVRKIIKEDERPRGGMVYGRKAEIIDEVINRVNQYGEEYIEALENLHNQFPSTKYKTIEPTRKVILPPGVKVQNTVYPK